MIMYKIHIFLNMLNNRILFALTENIGKVVGAKGQEFGVDREGNGDMYAK